MSWRSNAVTVIDERDGYSYIACTAPMFHDKTIRASCVDVRDDGEAEVEMPTIKILPVACSAAAGSERPRDSEEWRVAFFEGLFHFIFGEVPTSRSCWSAEASPTNLHDLFLEEKTWSIQEMWHIFASMRPGYLLDQYFLANLRDMLMAIAAATEGDANLAGRGVNTVFLQRVGKQRICTTYPNIYKYGTLDGLSISRIGERTGVRTIRLHCALRKGWKSTEGKPVNLIPFSLLLVESSPVWGTFHLSHGINEGDWEPPFILPNSLTSHRAGINPLTQ